MAMTSPAGKNEESDLLWKVLHYGVVTLFEDLPPRLRKILIRDEAFTDARSSTWRRLLLDRGAFATPVDELLLPVRSLLKKREGTPEDALLPPPVESRTEYLTLARQYDGRLSTPYFIGRSPQTGLLYWAEEGKI
jgi:hypothetical protein